VRALRWKESGNDRPKAPPSPVPSAAALADQAAFLALGLQLADSKAGTLSLWCAPES